MDRSVAFGITTVLLPGESASIVEEVMSIFVGGQFVSEQHDHHLPNTTAINNNNNDKRHNYPNLFQLDQFLMDVKPDRELVSEFQPWTDPSAGIPEDLAQVFVKLGIDNSIIHNDDDDDEAWQQQQQQRLASRLSSLALDPSTRPQALRHIIMRVAFGSTALNSGSSISMLPPFVAAFGRHLGEFQPDEPSLQHGGNLDVFSTALTKWRQLSVYLLRHHRHHHHHRRRRAATSPSNPSEDVSTQQAQQLAVELNRFLAPFVAVAVAEDDDDDGLDKLARYEQENDLREALVECATFAYVLFLQPSEYRFVYSDGKKSVKKDDGHVSSEKIVVCPGLQRVRDEEGRRYPSPRILMCPVVEETIVAASSNTIGTAI
ncbi:hypothetical protein PG994_003936 [Apiospora phragmitis]|uniref:Uncharacterized protein n=1 Tax=Apiospora phragmitis TaxID=2905665 RepID=A0ABR1VZI8_9PEZI